jgi:hypothetical protein
MLQRSLLTPRTSSKLSRLEYSDISHGDQRPVLTQSYHRAQDKLLLQQPVYGLTLGLFHLWPPSQQALPLPAGDGDGAQLAQPSAPQSPRAGRRLLPFLASAPGPTSFPVSPSVRQGQRMLCHPHLLLTGVMKHCLLGKHFEQLGERCLRRR